MKTRFTLFFIVVLTYIFQTTVTAQPYSNDFFPETTIQSPWTFYDPVGDATLTWTGTNAEISVPSTSEHDLWTGSDNKAPRMLQPAPDTDFQVEIKFESVPSATYQLQGIIVQEDNDTFIRFGTYYGSGPKLFVAVIDGSSLIQTPSVVTISSIPPYIRVTRTGSNWNYEYSNDGSSWNQAASFTQAFTVTEVGFYAGNAGGNPAFTASADYFMNTADPIIDTDTQGVTPPVIEVWYGDTQTFGNLGNPQQWVNILGRVSDDNGIGSLTYSLNGSPDVPLSMGANGTRLVGNGDFATEIDHANLVNGVNTVEFTATDALGAQAVKTVTLNYTPGNVWPLPYTADFTTLNSIEDINTIANIVDGLWELTPDGIRTTETGYDRLIVLGDETWTTDYEVTAEMTIHSAASGSGVGFAVGWQGHTGSNSPRTEWPLEAIGWVRNFPSSSLRILTYTSGIQDQMSVSISANTKYLLKARSEDIGGGQSRFSVKIWEEGTTEPASYMITADITDRNGSVLLITHKADVTWGSVEVNPIAVNQSPQFTSSPVTIAQAGQAYNYNITASDPNTSDVLTITAPTLPSWLSFFDNGNGTATLSGTPSSFDLGSHPVELLVEDGNTGSAAQNFSIIVSSGAGTLPVSDQFCATNIGSHWTIFDPYDTGAGIQTGESSFGINNGALEISIPGNEGSHDLATNSSPRVLQTIPNDDFGVEVKFNSVPSSQYQMQGIIVQTSGGGRLRFETYYGTSPYFYANSYGVPFGSSVINQPIGGAIPAYLRLIRNGNSWEFDYSYDGTNWTNVVTTSINVMVTEVGFYGANHNPNPAFTLSAEYFRNINDPVPSCSIEDPTLTIGSASTVVGSYITIPVDLNAPEEFQLDFMIQGKIHFDTNKLKFLYGDFNAGTLINDFGWSGAVYSVSPGAVDLVFSGTNPIDDNGTLLNLTFQVIDANAGSTSITSTTAELAVDVSETPLTVVNGTVTYGNNSGTSANRGDATLDYVVDINDALAVIYHWIDLYPLTGQALTNADADFDSDVDLDDYLKIIFFVYLNDWDFAFPSAAPNSSVVMNNASMENAEMISVPVELVNSENVNSLEVQFEYDSSELEFVNVESNTSSSMNIQTAEKDGRLSFVAASIEEIENGEVATLRFKKLNLNSVSKLGASYKLNIDQLAGNNVLSIGSGSVTGVDDIENGVPEEFELSQNYPNPFNPSTVINFAVPEAGYYKLNVYNILGQKVATLINKQLQAGHHSSVFNASGLATGIYIYTLEGSKINIVKKMQLIK